MNDDNALELQRGGRRRKVNCHISGCLPGKTLYVKGYHESVEILKSHHLFSSNRRITLNDRNWSSAKRVVLIADDPPDHTDIRRLINKWFSKNSLNGMRGWIEELVLRHINEFDSRIVDIVRKLAKPIPVMVILKILGVPTSEWRRFERWSAIASGIVRLDTKEQLREVTSFYGYFNGLLQNPVGLPEDSLIFHLSSYYNKSSQFSKFEIQSLCVLLLTAGNETTTNLISNIFFVISNRPSLWNDFKSNNISEEMIINEVTRYCSPVQSVNRFVKSECIVNGKKYSVGDTVLIDIAQANRDPTVFKDPNEFIVQRETSSIPLGFGYGIHYCLGVHLAKMEAAIVLNSLKMNVINISSLAGAVKIDSNVVNGFEALPVGIWR